VVKGNSLQNCKIVDSNSTVIFKIWSCGRVVRLSSAKAATLIRTQLGPLKNKKMNLEIRKIYQTIENFLKIENYQGINDFIDKFLAKDLDLTLYVSLLIAINSKKTKVSKYSELYNQARKIATKKCKDKGIDELALENEVDLLLLEFK
jgi:hypothetical protein